VGNKQLNGETAEAEAQVQQWVDFADNEILPAACTWVFPCLGITQFNKQVRHSTLQYMVGPKFFLLTNDAIVPIVLYV
jgi:elongation factor 1-gamma